MNKNYVKITLLISMMLLSCNPLGGTSSSNGRYTPGLSISSVSSLSELTVSSGALTPIFSQNTSNYTGTVSYSISTLTVTSTAAQSAAQIKVNGIEVVSGAPSSAINLAVGTNTISVVVTAEDGVSSTTYTINITRNQNTSTVTPSVDGHTTSVPSTAQSVVVGSTQAFTVTASTGYTVSTIVGGTCAAGTWSGSVYTTGIISSDCTVIFSSSLSGPAGQMNASWVPSWTSVVAYWGLEESSAGTVSGGSADFLDGGPVGTHHGTHSGTISYGATGKTGNGVSLAASGCITIPAASSFNTTVLTAMSWVKTTSTGIGNILSFYNNASSFQGWALILNNVSGKGSFWGGTSNGFKNTSSSVLNNGNWHHFAVILNGTSLKMYVDGALDSTFTVSAIPSYSGPGAIGADGDCLQKITGTLDEIAVWGIALADADITTIYNYQNTH